MNLVLQLSVAFIVVTSLVFLCFLMSDAIALLRLCKDRLPKPLQEVYKSLDSFSQSETDSAVSDERHFMFIGAQDQDPNISGNEKRSRRKKRSFAWPPRSLFSTKFTLEVPLYSPDGVGIPFLLEVPYRFRLPNSTKPFVRKRSAQERYSFYKTIELLFSRLGYDGHCCMLRAVCERADSEVMTEGLLGEVLNLLLAVSMLSEHNSELLWEYNEAENIGKAQGNCEEKYSGCPFSIFHLFD